MTLKHRIEHALRGITTIQPILTEDADIEAVILSLDGRAHEWRAEFFEGSRIDIEEQIDGTVTRTPMKAYEVSFIFGVDTESETTPKKFANLDTALHWGIVQIVNRNLGLEMGMV